MVVLLVLYGVLHNLLYLTGIVGFYFLSAFLFIRLFRFTGYSKPLTVILPILVAAFMSPTDFHWSVVILGSGVALLAHWFPTKPKVLLPSILFISFSWYVAFGCYTFYSYVQKTDLTVPISEKVIRISAEVDSTYVPELGRLIQLWHISCKPCRIQHHALKSLANSYENEISVELLNLDDQSRVAFAKKYLTENQFNSHFKQPTRFIDSLYATQGYPVLLVVKHNRTSYLLHGGYILHSEFYWLHRFLIYKLFNEVDATQIG